jgi:hypothetical protein
MTLDDLLHDELAAGRPKADFTVWLVWRQGKDGPEFMGAYTQQDAEAEVAFLNRRGDRGWRATGLMMIGEGWTELIRDLTAYHARFRQWQRENGIDPQ